MLFAALIVVLRQFWFHDLLSTSNFLNWDAQHYQYIKEFGYEGFRVAFFPLFPLIWKISDLGVHGIVLLNGTVFLISFYLLIKMLQIKDLKEILIYLSIPSFIFFYLPYSESVFFLSSFILLLGIKDRKYWLIYLGLLFAILGRPAFTVFIPALIIMELIFPDGNKLFVRLTMYLLITVIGIALVSLIQYHDTNEWFKFFSVQEGWGNKLQLPNLPLTSWAGGFVVRLDGLAFLIGVLAGLTLTAFILKLKVVANKAVPREVIFSLSYLGGMTLLVLIFKGGSLFSLNRFIFATPFIIVILNYWFSQKFHYKIGKLLYIFAFILLFWLLFASYGHIQTMMKFFLISLYAWLPFLIKSDRFLWRNAATIALIASNITFQILLYLRFLNGAWVG